MGEHEETLILEDEMGRAEENMEEGDGSAGESDDECIKDE